MGIFDFLKKKNKTENDDRVVTTAADPSTFTDEKLQEDLEIINKFNNTLEDVDSTISTSNPASTDDNAFDIKNPFVGE